MRGRLMTILMVVVISIAGAGVLYAAGNEPLNSPAVRSSYTLQQANRQLPTDRAPLAAACVTGGAYNSACDVDHDGDVDIFDIQLAAGHWGQTGAYSAGAAGIPTLGFGPQEERYVHAADDQVDLAKLTKAAAFYALFPLMFVNREGDQ